MLVTNSPCTHMKTSSDNSNALYEVLNFCLALNYFVNQLQIIAKLLVGRLRCLKKRNFVCLAGVARTDFCCNTFNLSQQDLWIIVVVSTLWVILKARNKV